MRLTKTDCNTLSIAGYALLKTLMNQLVNRQKLLILVERLRHQFSFTGAEPIDRIDRLLVIFHPFIQQLTPTRQVTRHGVWAK